MRWVESLAVYGSYFLAVITFPFSLIVCMKTIQEYERAIIFRLGLVRTGGMRGPGIFFILPCIDDFYATDMRVRSLKVPPQEALTKDSMTVTVGAVVYYKIVDPMSAITKIDDYSRATLLLAMTTLRDALGTRNLADAMSDREGISKTMQIILDIGTDPWGIKVQRVEIKNISLPERMQRMMAAEAEAAREAKARVIAAEGERNASTSLKEAADVISKSPGALQLRYLQTLNTIAGAQRSTIVFPFPMEVLSSFVKK